MKEIPVREMRAVLARLEDVVEREGELVVTRRGKAVARVLPVGRSREMPSHAELREAMPYLDIPSADLIRADRDARG